jgi:SAM-dependent methyltransferase
MGIIGGSIGYWTLRALCPDGANPHCAGNVYAERSKLEVLFGPQVWDELQGRDVVDFGCGAGVQAIELAQHGANRVTGIDIRETALAEAREAAERAEVSDRCFFAQETNEKVDVILAIDSFEHFADPLGVLQVMRCLLRDSGFALISFGPPWGHPLGGHLFSVFPWAHLLFTERSLIRWRSDFKCDGAARFGEVEGGLNQMTIRRFEHLVAASEFEFASFDAVPIRPMRFLASRLAREFTTSTVRCRLVPRQR